MIKTMNSEHQIQAACVVWFQNTHCRKDSNPNLSFLLHHNNNNGHGKREGAILKAIGVKSGVADLEFIYKGNIHFIEMKKLGGRMSNEQKKFKTAVENQGCYYYLIYSLDEFKELITKILKENG